MELPALRFGRKPRWELINFEGEWMVLGYRTLDGQEGVNEIHRITAHDGAITRVRIYCFCPDSLQAVANSLGLPVVKRRLAYRSPSFSDVRGLLLRHFMGEA